MPTWKVGRTWLGWELIEVVAQGDGFGILADKYPLLEHGQVDVVAEPRHVPLDAVVWSLDLFDGDQKTLFPRSELGVARNPGNPMRPH